MKKKLFLLFASFIVLTLKAQEHKHVILVTIDGFRPDFYFEDKWNTPNLKQMLREGVHAYGVNSVFPSVTYPSHTTIVTGVQPADHGIYFNGVFEPDSTTGKIYWNFNEITSPTIWKAAKSAGLKVASLMWPASAGAPIDFNISDIGSMGEEVREKYAWPKGIMDTIRREVFSGKQEIKWGEDEYNAQTAAWVIRNKKPNLMTIHLISVDHAEHTVGREGQMVEDAIHEADRSIGIIRQAIKDAGMEHNTLLIVTGDHGFYNVEKSINPNVWLAKAGLLDPQDESNWKARFFQVGGAAFLFLRDEHDQQTKKQVLKMLKSLPSEEKKYFRIVDAAQMKEIGANPHVSFALSGLSGAAFGKEVTGEAILSGEGGTHGYFPNTRNIQTGFIAIAPNIKKGLEIKQLDLRDVTVFVKEYLNLDLPTARGRSSVKYYNAVN
ncbi:alkaline phosphatase family protein [Olivibacter domesticus]|uniref:Predicted pyrophosphatase or phosphodiesterase, AlkP superfamily n=1 Tax=Olivibacter domesticus TaxID=407022 RepID=A0A1H7LT67_OLID1|nr:ectonucleotide pyrophosphatase/phosphodiesterase [Olivibacter domesticus]SEL02161.1 Predicted pyrophosphatase or phosphodiesterase, AlkP superfamily [Olivibacter domesticus]